MTVKMGLEDTEKFQAVQQGVIKLVAECFFEHSFLEGCVVADQGEITNELKEGFPDIVKAGRTSQVFFGNTAAEFEDAR